MEVPGVTIASWGVQAQIGEALEEDAEGGLHFDAGQRGPNA